VNVSIIICTYNRAADLAATLDSLKAVSIPSNLKLELLVIDNGSTDSTPLVTQGFRSEHIVSRYVSEPRRGKCYAYNRGLSESKGELLIFLDDDVRPARNWLMHLTKPLVDRTAEAVAGAIIIPSRLRRNWMDALHLSLLASTESWEGQQPVAMNGANMAFSRQVLEKVPAFDPELGPGALGFWDEALFSRQLLLAGFRIASAPEAAVEHHFHEDRLTRKAFVDRAEKEGRSLAYVSWHWGHDPFDRSAKFKGWKKRLLLRALRVLRRNECRISEGCAVWEIRGTRTAAYFEQYAIEQRRPRGYKQNGLCKIC
jgi:glucosyl-dolichyl phosphate glucuronosyltransferase